MVSLVEVCSVAVGRGGFSVTRMNRAGEALPLARAMEGFGIEAGPVVGRIEGSTVPAAVHSGVT